MLQHLLNCAQLQKKHTNKIKKIKYSWDSHLMEHELNNAPELYKAASLLM